MILGVSFGVYPNPLALKIASGEPEPFLGEGKRFEDLWYSILLRSDAVSSELEGIDSA